MRKIILIVTTLFLISLLHAEPLNTFRFGFFVPSATGIGTITGYSYGARFDDRITIYTSGDLFYRNYTKEKRIGYISGGGQTTVETYLKTTDISTYYLPIMVNGQIHIPIEGDFPIYVGGGFGIGLLWDDVYVASDHTHLPVNETKFFSGFNWNLCVGTRYELSRYTAIIGELFYHNGSMRRDVLVTPVGITWHEINMDGIGLRVGLEVPAF